MRPVKVGSRAFFLVTLKPCVFTCVECPTPKCHLSLFTGEYYLAVNPTNDSIVVSDSVGRRLYMARTRNMGSRHSSLQLQRRKVTYPKGLVFDLNGDMYLADSRSIRVIYVNGSSEDVIGRSAQTLEPWRPLSCGQSVLARDMLLQWPTAMAFDARSRSLFFLDGTSVYRLHLATKLVSLVAGRPLNCPPVKDSELGGGEEAPLALNAVLKKVSDCFSFFLSSLSSPLSSPKASVIGG